MQEIFSNPNVGDDKIAAAMKNFDRAPIDKSIRDLANILKLLVTEHQLSLQSLRIISVAMDKVGWVSSWKRLRLSFHLCRDVYSASRIFQLSLRTNGDQLPAKSNVPKGETPPTPVTLSRSRRDALPRPALPLKRTGPFEDFEGYESFSDLGRPRQKR